MGAMHRRLTSLKALLKTSSRSQSLQCEIHSQAHDSSDVDQAGEDSRETGQGPEHTENAKVDKEAPNDRLCNDCTRDLWRAIQTLKSFGGVYALDRMGRDEDGCLEHKETISRTQDVKTLLERLRSSKRCRWTDDYCVVCLRLSIEIRRALTERRAVREYTNPFESSTAKLVWTLHIRPSFPQAGQWQDYYLKCNVKFAIQDISGTLLPLRHRLELETSDSVAQLMSSFHLPCLDDTMLTLPPSFARCFPDLNPRDFVSCSRSCNHREIRDEFHDCNGIKGQDSSHVNCRGVAKTDPRWWPTRLLQIDRLTSAVRLVATRNRAFGTDEGYLSLSHCWGNSQGRFLLTTQTKEQMENGIPTTRLARSFQDAIDLATRFGFEFVWIDSLCILQDSEADWQTESALMGKVYENATFNIAAAEAVDDDEGFLPIRDPSVLRGFFFIRNNAAGSRDFDEQAGLKLTWLQSGCSCEWNDSLRFNLATRGWVFQERHFATKTLMVDDLSVRWSCPTESSSVWPCQPVEFQKKDHFLYWWISMLKSYNSTRLTYAKDRLIAMSSIAEKVSLLRGSRYFAGLFEHEFVFQLGWCVDSGDVADAPADNIAPSWSWAAVNNNIKFWQRPGRYTPLAKLIDVVVESTRKELIFGQVRSGQLSLLCDCLPVTISCNDGQLLPDVQGLEGFVFQPGLSPDSTTSLQALSDPEQRNSLFAIPVALGEASGPGFSRWWSLTFLLVKQVSKTNVFRRLGTLHHPIQHRDKVGIDIWRELIRPSAPFADKYQTLYYSPHGIVGKETFWDELTADLLRHQSDHQLVTLI